MKEFFKTDYCSLGVITGTLQNETDGIYPFSFFTASVIFGTTSNASPTIP